jgi:hypothetical protein
MPPPWRRVFRISRVADPRGTNLTQVLLDEADLRGVQTGVVTPAFSRGLSDDELAAVSDHLIRRFGGKTGTVERRRCPPEPRKSDVRFHAL